MTQVVQIPVLSPQGRAQLLADIDYIRWESTLALLSVSCPVLSCLVLPCHITFHHLTSSYRAIFFLYLSYISILLERGWLLCASLVLVLLILVFYLIPLLILFPLNPFSLSLSLFLSLSPCLSLSLSLSISLPRRIFRCSSFFFKVMWCKLWDCGNTL